MAIPLTVCSHCDGSGFAKAAEGSRIRKRQDAFDALTSLADEEVAKRRDFGPYAREIAMADVLKTQRGRELYDEYSRNGG